MNEKQLFEWTKEWLWDREHQDIIKQYYKNPSKELALEMLRIRIKDEPSFLYAIPIPVLRKLGYKIEEEINDEKIEKLSKILNIKFYVLGGINEYCKTKRME